MPSGPKWEAQSTVVAWPAGSTALLPSPCSEKMERAHEDEVREVHQRARSACWQCTLLMLAVQLKWEAAPVCLLAVHAPHAGSARSACWQCSSSGSWQLKWVPDHAHMPGQASNKRPGWLPGQEYLPPSLLPHLVPRWVGGQDHPAVPRLLLCLAQHAQQLRVPALDEAHVGVHLPVRGAGGQGGSGGVQVALACSIWAE